jgi:transposase
MKPIKYVRELKEKERAELKKGLRSTDGFVLRRSQILIASSEGKSITEIMERVGCGKDTIRRVIDGFNAKGLEVLEKGSKVAHNLRRAFTEETAKKLKELLHESPREYGKESSLWTLGLLAEVCFEKGLTKEKVSGETIRNTLKRQGISWKRAKHWITSPDPHYAHKKNGKKI